MKKILISAVFLSVMSSSSFALEIYKGQITKHKEWNTGNAKVFFKQGSVKNTLATEALKMDQSYAYVASNAEPGEGKVGEPVTVKGNHNLYVMNNTKSTQTYFYTLSLCAETTSHTSQCGYYQDEIQLEPNGYFNASEEPVLQIKFDKPGSYKTSVASHLNSSYDSPTVMQTSSSSNNQIIIQASDQSKL